MKFLGLRDYEGVLRERTSVVLEAIALLNEQAESSSVVPGAANGPMKDW